MPLTISHEESVMTPPRQFRTDPERLLEEGKQLLKTLRHPKTTAEGRFRHRIEAVMLIVAGVSPQILCAVFAESIGTLRSWVRMADEKGYMSLYDHPSPGRAPSLNAEQMHEVGLFLRSTPAETADGTWDGPALAAYLNREYGLELSVRQCQRMLRRMLPMRLSRPAAKGAAGQEDGGSGSDENIAAKALPGARKKQPAAGRRGRGAAGDSGAADGKPGTGRGTRSRRGRTED
ncbi:MAG: winged helix-turn-helix domain-containing protein [Desulfovibrionaceae bacterium]|nr:winged helix-turn-helix domain-containing protein [Desulfovibrionaceae bacterium]